MLMKDKFQSKAVPRGTRTIWRYLSALFILFTFAIGQMWGADPQDTYYKFTATASAGATIAPVSGDGGNITLGSNSAAKITAQNAWYTGVTYTHAININSSDAKSFSLNISGTAENPAHVFVLVTSDNRVLKLKYDGADVDQCSVRGTAGVSSYTAAASLVELVTTNTGSHVVYASGSAFVYAVRVVYEKNDLWQEIKGLSDATLDKDKTLADDLSTLYFFRMQDLCFNTDGVISFGNTVSTLRYSINFKAQKAGTVTINYANPGGSTRTLKVTEFTRPSTAGTGLVSKSVASGTTSYSDQEFDVESGKEYVISFGGGATIKSVHFVAAAPKYDVVFANGGEGTGSMATLKYEAGEQVTLPACGYTPASSREFNGWTSSDVTISAGKFTMPSKNVTITATWRDEAVKYTVTYDVNGGSSATPTETDKAAGDEFALAVAPEYEGYHFEGWLCDADAVTYDAEDAYTMTAANTTFTAQWKPYSTISIANKTYIIGSGNFNAVSDFSSNCEAAVIYELKESYSGVTLTPAGVFSATAAGEYIVVANQAGDATYAATSKEFTITVLDSELSDIYIWQKNAEHGGDGKCVTSAQANQNVNANQASTTRDYSTLVMDGMNAMGRPASPSTVTLTFSVRDAYKSSFGITNVCAYGKIEEAGGLEYSWNNVDWTAVAGGESDNNKHEFTAPAGTYAENFYIRFTNAEAGKGGLWFRNALVTLEVKKTVTSVTEALVGAEINGEAISAANLSTLQEDKTLDIATAYAAAPTVTFKKQVTTSYEGGWAPDVTNVDVEVTASDNTTAWQASATIGGQAYTINLAKPAGPSLETEATAFTLTSAKIATDTKNFTFSGVNLTAGNVTIGLESPVAGLSVTPAEVTPTAGVITDQEVTITYKSLENVAEAVVNLVVAYDVDTKITIPLTYSSTVGYEDLTPISAATTWNWDGAASAAYGTLGQNEMIILANADVTWGEGFNARAIAGKLQHYYRDSKYAQGNELKFNTTIPGKVYVTYSNTGGNAARTVNVNGVKGSLSSSNNKDADKCTESFAVTAGDVLIKGVLVSDDSDQMLRYYEVRFAPVFAVTYAAGEGSVKGGETMPTQADEAAGEKIVLAAATALEKTGDDFAGWLCSVDGVTYQPGDEYTMTAAATTFTAQWVEHVEPVDPTLTYDNGAYTIGLAALDLSTLITAKTSTGAITYSVKEAGTTGAAIDGNNFTATAAGTATITASQAAVLGYNAKTVDFNVVVTEPVEIDGVKLVEAGALTGNYITSSTLSTDGAPYVVEGLSYSKYIKFGGTFSGSYSNGARNNYLIYDLNKQNTTFYMYVHNNSGTEYKIVVYAYDNASSKLTEIPVAGSTNALKSFSLNDVTENTRVFIGVNNTNIYFCQVVAVESGADLMKAGEPGYSIDFGAKSRFTAASGIAIDLDGMEFVTSSGYTPNSSMEVALGEIGTNYVKFKLDAPTTVEVKTNSTNQYYIGSTYDADEATSKTYGYKPTSNGETHSFDLTAGTWYLNPNTSNIKLTKLAFSLPKCAEPAFNALTNSDICSGDSYVALDGTATVADAGVPTYQWYREDDTEITGETNATYTPDADGKYYVIAVNHLAGFSDNEKKSDLVTVTTYASAEITTAPADVRQTVGENATLTVVATGKAPLSYQWYTCDENGDNAVLIAGAEEASYTVNVTANLDQFYKVVVTSGCGEASAVAHVVEWVELPQVNVNATTTWDWVNISDEDISLTNSTTPEKNEECVLANVKVGNKMPTNDETFNSQALLFYGEHVRKVESGRKYATIGHIKFTTTVAGKVTVEFSDNGNNNRKVKINDAVSESSTSKTDVKTFSAVVTPGEVNIEGVKEDGTGNNQYIRISKIIFSTTDVEGADYVRDVSEGRYGTICLPNGGVMVGAEIFTLAYYGATSQKFFFDEVPSGEMEAGKPYLFLPREGATQLGVYYTDAAGEAAKTVNGFVGFIGADADDYTQVPANDNCYIISNNLYRQVQTGAEAYILSNRAYIDMTSVTNIEPAKAPGARRIGLGKDAAQGFENLQSGDQPMKVMINGTMYILRGEKVYDATGRLVK